MQRRRRGWFPWVSAAILVLAIAALARRCSDESARPRPEASAQPPSRMSPQPAPAPASRAPTRSPLPPTPRPALPDDTTSSPSATGVDPPAPATPIPTELPESPSLAKKLSRDGAVPDYREVYAYQLGLMAFTEQCMGGRVAKGVIYYYIHWDVDDDHFGTSPRVEPAGVPPEGQVTDDDQQALLACVKQYVTSHDQVQLPHAPPGEISWGNRAVFPLSDSLLLRWIAEAKSAH